MLLSKNYYNSAYCMNEMGATWIYDKVFIPFVLPELENETLLGVIGNNKQYGVINKEVMNTFYDTHIKPEVTKVRPTNEVEKARDNFIKVITGYKAKNELLKVNNSNSSYSDITKAENKSIINQNTESKEKREENNKIDILINKGFSDIEKLFIKYIKDTDRVRFMCGWQEHVEIKKIKTWEELNGLIEDATENYINGPLSGKYSNVLQKFEIRKFLKVSALTSGNNPKEYQIDEDIFDNIINMSEDSIVEIERNFNRILAESKVDLPF